MSGGYRHAFLADPRPQTRINEYVATPERRGRLNEQMKS